MGNMSKEQAMQEYVDKMDEVDPGLDIDIILSCLLFQMRSFLSEPSTFLINSFVRNQRGKAQPMKAIKLLVCA